MGLKLGGAGFFQPRMKDVAVPESDHPRTLPRSLGAFRRSYDTSSRERGGVIISVGQFFAKPDQ